MKPFSFFMDSKKQVEYSLTPGNCCSPKRQHGLKQYFIISIPPTPLLYLSCKLFVVSRVAEHASTARRHGGLFVGRREREHEKKWNEKNQRGRIRFRWSYSDCCSCSFLFLSFNSFLMSSLNWHVRRWSVSGVVCPLRLVINLVTCWALRRPLFVFYEIQSFSKRLIHKFVKK